jgi:hypothetical protein
MMNILFLIKTVRFWVLLGKFRKQFLELSVKFRNKTKAFLMQNNTSNQNRVHLFIYLQFFRISFK